MDPMGVLPWPRGAPLRILGQLPAQGRAQAADRGAGPSTMLCMVPLPVSGRSLRRDSYLTVP